MEKYFFYHHLDLSCVVTILVQKSITLTLSKGCTENHTFRDSNLKGFDSEGIQTKEIQAKGRDSSLEGFKSKWILKGLLSKGIRNMKGLKSEMIPL